MSWQAPSSDAAADFDHYRVYMCNKSIEKKDNKVVCSGELTFQKVAKDKLGANITYTLPSLKDTLYVRIVTRNQDREESDLSKQVMLKPDSTDTGDNDKTGGGSTVDVRGNLVRTVSLANSYYLIRTSDNFKPSHPVEHLWDRCTENTKECTSGSDESNTVWLEFDFKRPYLLQDASLFGDAKDKWQSRNWSLSYKLEKGEKWQSAFTRVDAQVNDWVKKNLNNISARYVRVEIAGDPETTTVQARELEIVGQRP